MNTLFSAIPCSQGSLTSPRPPDEWLWRQVCAMKNWHVRFGGRARHLICWQALVRHGGGLKKCLYLRLRVTFLLLSPSFFWFGGSPVGLLSCFNWSGIDWVGYQKLEWGWSDLLLRPLWWEGTLCNSTALYAMQCIAPGTGIYLTLSLFQFWSRPIEQQGKRAKGQKEGLSLVKDVCWFERVNKWVW